MGCKLCGGCGRFPLLDQWKMLAYMQSHSVRWPPRNQADVREPAIAEVLTDAACPRCRLLELMHYLSYRLESEGVPFNMPSVVGLMTQDGITVSAMVCHDDFPVAGHA